MIPIFTTEYVRGFINAEILPTKSCPLTNSPLALEKFSVSCFSLPKALITRTPERFSLAFPVITSSFPWTFLYRGEVIAISPKMITESTGIVTTKIRAIFTLMVKAMTMAPKTIKGLLRKSRRNRFRPFCTWLMSLVILVISVLLPMVSISENPSCWI